MTLKNDLERVPRLKSGEGKVHTVNCFLFPWITTSKARLSRTKNGVKNQGWINVNRAKTMCHNIHNYRNKNFDIYSDFPAKSRHLETALTCLFGKALLRKDRVPFFISLVMVQ